MSLMSRVHYSATPAELHFMSVHHIRPVYTCLMIYSLGAGLLAADTSALVHAWPPARVDFTGESEALMCAWFPS